MSDLPTRQNNDCMKRSESVCVHNRSMTYRAKVPGHVSNKADP